MDRFRSTAGPSNPLPDHRLHRAQHQSQETVDQADQSNQINKIRSTTSRSNIIPCGFVLSVFFVIFNVDFYLC